MHASRNTSIVTRVLGFLGTEGWAELVLLFAIAWVVAAAIVCVVNYMSTFFGLKTLLPGLDDWVIVSFVIFIQGAEFIVPVMEMFEIHGDMAEGYKISFRVAWFVAIIVDYMTAFIWFNDRAGMGLSNLAAAFKQNPALMLFTEFVILVFSLIFLVAEILLVLGIRTVVHRGAALFQKWGLISSPSPTENEGMPQRPTLQPAISLIARPDDHTLVDSEQRPGETRREFLERTRPTRNYRLSLDALHR